jgi:hypothetical protein
MPSTSSRSPPSNLSLPHHHITSLSWVRSKTEPPTPPHRFPHIAASRRGPERLLGQALRSSMASHGGRSIIDRALCSSTTCGLSPQTFPIDNNSELWKIHTILQRTPFLYLKSSRSPLFQTDAPKSERISRYSPSQFLEIINKSLKFFSPYLCNRNSDFDNSLGKILRITSSFISCIHNTCLLHIN